MQQVRESGVLEPTKSALRMALGTLLSRILGLARDIILAALFSRLITDAFVVAFRLPNFFRRLIGEGSIASTFTPLYMAETGERAQALRRTVFLFLFSLSASLSVLGIIFMRPLLTALVASPEYLAVPDKFTLTVWLARWMFSCLFLVTNYAFFSALAHAHGRFFWPAVAPAFFNLVIIVSAFMPKVFLAGDSLGFGVLVGGVLQNIVAAIAIWPQLKTIFRKPTAMVSLRPFLARLIPTVMGLGGAQAIALLNIYFAARLPTGSLSYIYFADRLLDLPLSLVAVSLGSALLPTLSMLWHEKNHAHFVATLVRQLEVLLFLVLPSALGLGLMSRAIVAALFQHGGFGGGEAETTADVLFINAFILIFVAATRLIVVALHATSRYRVSALISLVGAMIHFAVATLFTARFGILGLMWATLFSAVCIALGNLVLFISHRELKAVAIFSRISRFFLRLSPGLILLSLVVVVLSGLLGHYQDSIGGVGLTICTAAAIYFLTCKITGVFRHLEIGQKA
jgi:putative peptidoglycan lipid II flippase